MTGAPNIGVTAFKGRILLVPGTVISRLQSKAMHVPVNIVTGTNILWLDEPSINRAMCGTAKPINEMGPQKAVVVAVNNPEQKRMAIRVRLILTPKLAAYISPSNKAFSGFTNRAASNKPVNEKRKKYGSCVSETPEKSPNPHIT